VHIHVGLLYMGCAQSWDSPSHTGGQQPTPPISPPSGQQACLTCLSTTTGVLDLGRGKQEACGCNCLWAKSSERCCLLHSTTSFSPGREVAGRACLSSEEVPHLAFSLPARTAPARLPPPAYPQRYHSACHTTPARLPYHPLPAATFTAAFRTRTPSHRLLRLRAPHLLPLLNTQPSPACPQSQNLTLHRTCSMQHCILQWRQDMAGLSFWEDWDGQTQRLLCACLRLPSHIPATCTTLHSLPLPACLGYANIS